MNISILAAFLDFHRLDLEARHNKLIEGRMSNAIYNHAEAKTIMRFEKILNHSFISCLSVHDVLVPDVNPAATAPRPAARPAEPTPHKWGGWGWLAGWSAVLALAFC
jgi:hypothetical protein